MAFTSHTHSLTHCALCILRIRIISDALDACKIMVVLGSETYGGLGTDAFGTLEGESGLRI